jgi:hypothetical protein
MEYVIYAWVEMNRCRNGGGQLIGVATNGGFAEFMHILLKAKKGVKRTCQLDPLKQTKYVTF